LEQLAFFKEHKPRARKGPPNRMNNLSYREWMKFQKSFFRAQKPHQLARQCVEFFTKSKWDDGRPSNSLLVGPQFGGFKAHDRHVEVLASVHSLNDVLTALFSEVQNVNQYDFVLVDLRDFIDTEDQLDGFLEQVKTFYQLLRQLLRPERYSVVLAGIAGPGGAGFPFAWSIGLACRGHLRLRDEKVAIWESSTRKSPYYLLIIQATADEREPRIITSRDFVVGSDGPKIPAWIIPKSPPRKANEILHPAKFPETLVRELINVFSAPGDTIFDPMVGTGSSIVAAVQEGRHGVGVELIPKWAAIARTRVQESIPPLLRRLGKQPTAVIVEGDATKLNFIEEIRGAKLRYTITSPPYWSILQNEGSENQEDRRAQNLPLTYSSSEADLGNINDYDLFMKTLVDIYESVVDYLDNPGYLTVVVKNVKLNHVVYPIAWDLASLLASGSQYEYLGTTLWCQDDIPIKPFAVGIHWVSNVLHHYCLHFRKKQ